MEGAAGPSTIGGIPPSQQGGRMGETLVKLVALVPNWPPAYVLLLVSIVGLLYIIGMLIERI